MERYYIIIIKIINKILGISNISIKDVTIDLKNIGVDSLSFVQIIIEIEECFKIEFPNQYLIYNELNTIKKIVKVLCELKNEDFYD